MNIHEWAAKQPTEFLMCRDTGIRHPWKSSTVRREGNRFIETLICPRCTTEKDRHIIATGSLAGQIVRVRMRYPEGYVRERGMGRVTKQEHAVVRMLSLSKRVT